MIQLYAAAAGVALSFLAALVHVLFTLDARRRKVNVLYVDGTAVVGTKLVVRGPDGVWAGVSSYTADVLEDEYRRQVAVPFTQTDGTVGSVEPYVGAP